MHDPLRHLPFLLVLFIILFTGLTDAAVDAGARVMVTLLAPALWLGLYLLGSDRSPRSPGDRPPKAADHAPANAEGQAPAYPGNPASLQSGNGSTDKE